MSRTAYPDEHSYSWFHKLDSVAMDGFAPKAVT